MFRWFRKKQGMANGAMCTWHAVLLFFLLSLVLSRNVEWMVQSGEQRASQEVETKQRRSSWLIFSKLSMTRKRMHMLLLAQQHPANIVALQRSELSSRNLNAVRSRVSRPGAGRVRLKARTTWFATNQQVVCAVGSVPCQNRMSTCDALFWLHLGEDIFISGATIWTFPSQRRTSRCLGAVLRNQICVIQVNHLICKKALATADDRVCPHRT